MYKAKFARVLGVVGALFIPAVVMAQFVADQPLRAEALQALANSVTALTTRVANLEANRGVAVTKANIYKTEVFAATVLNDVGLAIATCNGNVPNGVDANDVILDCGCRATQGPDASGANSPQFDLRRVQMENRAADATCVCQALNANAAAGSGIVAIATCLRVP
jgi:hypothetical protein